MNENPLALLPELALLGGSIVGLLLGLFLPRHRQSIVRAVAAGSLVAAIALSLVAALDPAGPVFDGSYVVDTKLTVVRVVASGATLVMLAIAADELSASPRETELYTLMLLGTLGTVVLSGAADLLLIIAAYLVASIPLYGLAALAKDRLGTEAALKYYLVGAFFTTVLLAGVVLLFGVGGSTRYPQLAQGLLDAPRAAVAFGAVFVLAALLFKLGAVPAHFWVPDVTEGATTTVAAFVTTVPKLGAVFAVYRLVAGPLSDAPGNWRILVAVIAAASMTLGNLAAFFQTSVRRLLAYSTISQVGYLLMIPAVAGRSDLALPSLELYVAAYAVTNVGAFAVVSAMPAGPTLDDWTGTGRRHPALGVALIVCLLGLVGTPPTGVFVGKLTVFTATGQGGLGWLVVLAAINTVASLFYYLRWIGPIFRPAPPGALAAPQPVRWSQVAAFVTAALSLAVGVGSGLVLSGVSPG